MQIDDIPPLRIGLNAAIVAVTNRTPSILAVPASPGEGPADGLPFGPFDPARHRTFEASLRASVESQTALHLGYVEQLYTFGDRGRQMHGGGDTAEGRPHLVSVGYLALTRADAGPIPGEIMLLMGGLYIAAGIAVALWSKHDDRRRNRRRGRAKSDSMG